MTIYNLFIVSNFNYCPLAWHFCSMSSSNKMEKVQERALRFINNDFTSFVFHNTVPLHVRRMKQMATEVFKIVDDMSPEYIGGARWLSRRVSDFGARGRGFETYRRRVVSLSKTLYSSKVLVNYPGSRGSVPT